MSDVIEKMAEAIARSKYEGHKSMTFDMLSQESKDEAIRMWIPEAQAALTILEQEGWQRVPEGSVVVPREPSNKMLNEGMLHANGHVVEPILRSVYTAMISAGEESKWTKNQRILRNTRIPEAPANDRSA